MKKFEFVSPLTQKELLLKLSHITETTEKFRYRSWVEKVPAGKKFYGKVSGDTFELVPFIGGRNFCTPVFKGRVGTTQDKTLVTVTPTASRDDLWSLIITQIILVVTAIICVLSAVDHTFSTEDVLSLIVALGLAGAFAGLQLVMTKRVIDKVFIPAVETSLGAKIQWT